MHNCLILKMVNTRSTNRITADLEDRGIETAGSTPYDQRALLDRMTKIEAYKERVVKRLVREFYKKTEQPTHSYNLRSRKTN